MNFPDTIRVQPVEPARPAWGVIVGEILGKVTAAFLGGLFLMLGTNALHGYIPTVPPLGYWASVAVLLAIGTLRGSLSQGPWKWARR